MTLIRIINKETHGPIWIDVRFSNGGIPFDELEIAPGFPKWISPGEAFDIDMGDWQELLYKRTLAFVEGSDKFTITTRYRIKVIDEAQITTGFIWPLNISGFKYAADTFHLTENDAHWFTEDHCQIVDSLIRTFDVSEDTIRQAQSQILQGTKPDLIRLNSTARTIRQYFVEPYIQIGKKEPFPSTTCQIYVRLTNLTTNTSGIKMVIESDAYTCLALVGKCLIKAGYFELSPRTTMYSRMFADDYREHGFRVPVHEPLTNFFI